MFSHLTSDFCPSANCLIKNVSKDKLLGYYCNGYLPKCSSAPITDSVNYAIN